MAILSVRRNGVSHFYHHDGLGSTVQLTDANQNVTDSYVYRAFGEEQAVTGTTPNPLRFVGNQNYYTDGKSGLVLLGRRPMDRTTGRFITMDPHFDGTNWYAYVSNGPPAATDPSGLKQIKLDCDDPKSYFGLLISWTLKSKYMPKQCKSKIKTYCDEGRFFYESNPKKKSVTLSGLLNIDKIILAFSDCSMNPNNPVVKTKSICLDFLPIANTLFQALSSILWVKRGERW